MEKQDCSEFLSAARAEAGVKAPLTTVEDVSRFLQEQFRAIELPVSSISRQDYENDEHVNEGHVSRLLTIVDTDVIEDVVLPFEREHFEAEPGQTSKATPAHAAPMKRIFGRTEGPLKFYSRVNEEHGEMRRISVLLESLPEDPQAVSNYRVYGAGQRLRELLWVLTGRLALDRGLPTGKHYRRCVDLADSPGY